MLKKLTVRRRLLILLAVTLVSLGAITILEVNNAAFTQEIIDRVYLGGVEELHHLSNMEKIYIADIAEAVRKSENGEQSWSHTVQEIRELQKKAALSWNSYLSNPVALSGELKNQQNILIKMVQDTLSKIDIAVQNLSSQENKEDIAQFMQLGGSLFDTLDNLGNVHIQDSKNDFDDAKSSARSLFTMTLIILGLSIVLCLFVTLAIIKSIIDPLEYAVGKVNCVAEGDTAIEVSVTSGGELGSLLQAVKNTTQEVDKIGIALASVANGDLTVDVNARSKKDVLGNAVKNMITQMRKMIGEIKGEVNALSSSSQEIMASLSQLSSGAAETAAAVTETTTTVEELKQTAHLSAEKAKDVLSSSEETAHTVKSSEESIATTIEDMKQIQDKMQIISESILKLSEKGMAIAEIMNSVNDLAEQSNLLAVNAAIEAAKAGEQGRSFGVVAQEIRSLAEQSKQATVQVRSLLNEIQNATSAAVLATEQGSKAVTKGVSQSLETSKAIKAMVENTSVVFQAANQIVLSSQQQLVGVEQVTTAMTNIDEATNQHVGQLDQIKQAVGGLNQVSIMLKQLTDLYRLGV